MISMFGGVGAVVRVVGRRAGGVALATSWLAIGCSAGPSEAPEATLGRTQEAIHDPAEPVCMAPQLLPGSFSVPDNVVVPGEPTTPTYINATDPAFLEGLRARMPLLAPYSSPFTEDEVFIGGDNGWVRENLDGHGGIDYLSTTAVSSFPVRAIAAGTVVSVFYDGLGFGNMMVIEHTAPDGTRYRSVYAHLRNGAEHDCDEAQKFVGAITDPMPTAPIIDNQDRLGRYRLFMADPNQTTCPDAATNVAGTLDAFVWGDETTILRFGPGDTVEAGEEIGWSGNTGAGGIGFGLDANGNVNNAFANIHLHFHLAVYAAVPPSTTLQWISLDPYGAYGNDGTGCYDLGANTTYHRLFAPFYPDFHGVTEHNFLHYFDYYPSMGMALQTASSYTVDGQAFVAGSFQSGLSPVWRAQVGVTQADFQAAVTENNALGLQLKEIQVTPLADGPHFSGIWTQQTATSWSPFLIANDIVFDGIWADTIDNGGRFADHVSYFVGGTRIHAGVQVFDGTGPGDVPWGRSLAQLNSIDIANQSAGLRATSVSADIPGATSYGGVWVSAQGDWLFEGDISGGSAAYQTVHDQRIADGFRLYRLQAHSNGQRFAAIWSRNEQRPVASFVATGGTTCAGASGATVTLDSSTTTFDAAFVLGYEWTGPFGVVTGRNPVVTLPPGTHTIGLRVYDSRGFESSTTQTVTVMQDTTPPVITAPSSRTITTCTNAPIGTATAADACGGAVTITNNAPVKFGLGPTTVTWTARDQFGNTSTATQLVTANLGDDTSCCPNGTNIMTGTSNNNTLTGTSGSDCIVGRGGQDTINGNGGNDFISGGDGNDVLNGGSGNDRLYGGSGQDNLQGSTENDFLDGGEGDDECRGGSGIDEVRGGANQDRLFGEAGNDSLFGDDGDDTLDGGDGDDALNGGGLHDTCIGGTGSNTFVFCESQPSGGGGGSSGALTAAFFVTSDWGTGYCVDLRVTNPTVNLATSWGVTLSTNGAQIFTTWNGAFSGTSGTVTATPSFSWNQTIDAAETDPTVGFCANRPSGSSLPSVTSIQSTF